MARIVFGGYMFRYPMGGMLSNTLHYLIGLKKLGHDVYFIEKSGWNNSCFDPIKKQSSNDCTYGVSHVGELLDRFELKEKWCFLDFDNNYYGLKKNKLLELLNSADIYIDYGAHGTWENETKKITVKVLIDGEPGTTQIKMQMNLESGKEIPNYDYYFTVGQNLGNENCNIPTINKTWHKIFHPVDCSQFSEVEYSNKGSYTTVMNWQSRDNVFFKGKEYGHKDMEFEKIMSLPQKVSQKLEVAVAGKNTPKEKLIKVGWNIVDAHEVTISYDSFIDYIIQSKGEFSVCKNIFVTTNSGWFSDRSAVYLACGKPVIMQDTGLEGHLHLEKGFFVFNKLEEAISAMEEVNRNYQKHSKWAKELAFEYLDAKKVMKRFLKKINII